MLYFVREIETELFNYTWDTVSQPFKVITLSDFHLRTNWRVHFLKIAHFLWFFSIFIKWQWFEKCFYEPFMSMTKKDQVVFMCNPRAIMNIIPFIDKDVNKRIWFWDTLSRMGDWEKMFKLLKKTGIPMVSFDKIDAKNHQIRFSPTFYGMKKYHSLSGNTTFSFDLYFCGNVSKDICRIESLANIEEIAKREDLTYKFIQVGYGDSYISYKENLSNVAQSRCLIELNQEKQNGLSLRAMEALCFNRKLITNNRSVINYSFYTKENVFILGIDDLTTLRDFITSSYRMIPDSVIMEYDSDRWLDRLMS